MKGEATTTAIWIAATALVTGSASIVTRASGATSLDALLPSLVAIVMLSGWMSRHTPSVSPIAASAPLLVIVAGVLPAGPLQSLGLGLLVAGAVAMAIRALHESATLTVRSGAGLMLVALALMRLPGLPEGKAIETAAIVGGCGVLFGSLVAGRRVVPIDLILPFAVGVAIPLHPSRLSAIPLLFAALVWTLRARRVMVPAAALSILCILAGRWSWPLGAIAVALALATRRPRVEGSPLFAVPLAAKAALAQVVRTLPFLLASAGALRTPHTAFGVLILLVLSAFLRPSLAIFYGLAAAITLASGEESRNTRYIAPAAVIALLMLAMFSWSGALAAAFPLPVAITTLALVVLASAATIPQFRLVAATLISIAALAGVIALAPANARWQPVQGVIGAGESINIVAPGDGSVAEVVVSGGNLLDLPAGEIVADVDVIATGGTVYRRALLAGELSDWAALRQEHWFIARHGVPLRPAGPLEGSGASSYLSGAGIIEVAIPERIGLLRLTMRESAPADASLHVDWARILSGAGGTP